MVRFACTCFDTSCRGINREPEGLQRQRGRVTKTNESCSRTTGGAASLSGAPFSPFQVSLNFMTGNVNCVALSLHFIFYRLSSVASSGLAVVSWWSWWPAASGHPGPPANSTDIDSHSPALIVLSNCLIVIVFLFCFFCLQPTILPAGDFADSPTLCQNQGAGCETPRLRFLSWLSVNICSLMSHLAELLMLSPSKI